MTQDTITQAASEYMLALKAAKCAYEKLDIDLTPEALNAGAATILIHATKISPGSVSAHSNGNGHAVRKEADPYAEVVCEFCSGEVWDNRTNKKNPKGPDYKCKSQDCGAAAWVNKDGSLAWKQ